MKKSLYILYHKKAVLKNIFIDFSEIFKETLIYS